MAAAERIADVFGETSLYDILGVAPTASAAEIKKAYYKQARVCRPDKCPNDTGAHSRFQALSMVHQVLSDEEQRKLYDDTGEFGGGDADLNENTSDQWLVYYRKLFPKVTKSKILAFAAHYRGSDEEKRDVIAAYSSKTGGFRAGSSVKTKERPMQGVIDSVMLSSEDDADRFAAIIEQAIECGEADHYPAFRRFQRSRLASTNARSSSSSSSSSRSRSSSRGGGGSSAKVTKLTQGGTKRPKPKVKPKPTKEEARREAQEAVREEAPGMEEEKAKMLGAIGAKSQKAEEVMMIAPSSESGAAAGASRRAPEQPVEWPTRGVAEFNDMVKSIGYGHDGMGKGKGEGRGKGKAQKGHKSVAKSAKKRAARKRSDDGGGGSSVKKKRRASKQMSEAELERLRAHLRRKKASSSSSSSSSSRRSNSRSSSGSRSGGGSILVNKWRPPAAAAAAPDDPQSEMEDRAGVTQASFRSMAIS